MAASWKIESVSYPDVRALTDRLGVSETVASVLVRRGLGDPEAARAFLEPEGISHDPLLLGDMAAAVERLRTAVESGERICVHGDYDVDGICATALATLTLRELGANVGWHLPSRFEEGYGVSAATIARLAEDGVTLVLTVDCGITAVAEVEEARRLGVDMIVTDHHRPGESLPQCPIVATRPSDYPFPDLCGTGVVAKLAQALLGPEHPLLSRHADLVALATIADVVPLVDENRALTTAGLRGLSRTQKPGLTALMRVAGVDAATIDATAVAFRLAPRINAAGRLGRPDVALHLVLTDDAREADLLANELETLNRDRQAVEDRILREAVAAVEAWPPESRNRRAYVVWGEGWHEGVIGIVASRLVERFGRPVVLIAGEGDRWKGSGRSVPSFDLHAGLAACSDHLERFGGHRAAAGLSIRADRARGLRPGVRRARRRAFSATRISPRRPGSTRSFRQLRSRSSSHASSSDSHRSGSGTPTSRSSSPTAKRPAPRRSVTASTCAFECDSKGGMRAARSPSDSAASSIASRSARISTSLSG